MQTVSRNRGGFDPVTLVVRKLTLTLAAPLSTFAGNAQDFVYGITRASRLSAENRALKDQVNALSLYDERVSLLDQQIDTLRSQVGLKPLPGKERINLDVIGFSQVEGKLTLNGGTEKGIQPDMPVINGQGIVGVVEAVAKGQCDVLLLTSFGVKIGGIDISRKPPARGLLSGRGESTITMMMFDPKAPIASGDMVVTGGLSAHIPYGLVIGRVISAVDDPDYGTRRATIEPSVEIGTLREVQVLK
jgi:rod shape-determining protein MreC